MPICGAPDGQWYDNDITIDVAEAGLAEWRYWPAHLSLSGMDDINGAEGLSLDADEAEELGYALPTAARRLRGVTAE